MSAHSGAVGIVIPVRHEPSQLVIDLVREIHGYLPAAFILVVDDSPEEHWTEFEAVLRSELGNQTVRLLHRSGEQRWGRLAGAVLDGFRWLQANGYGLALCLDGDGQHDPAALPAMVRRLTSGADAVAGTRYSRGGSPGTGLTPTRLAISRGCHLMARSLFPGRTAGLHDTMSGMFGVRLASIDLQGVWVHRFKVLAQILAQHPGLKLAEVGYTFRPRFAGDSKAGLDEGGAYLYCLAKLTVLAYFRPGAGAARSIALQAHTS